MLSCWPWDPSGSQAAAGRGQAVILRQLVAVLDGFPLISGSATAEEAAGIARFGDLTGYAPAIQKLAAS